MDPFPLTDIELGALVRLRRAWQTLCDVTGHRKRLVHSSQNEVRMWEDLPYRCASPQKTPDPAIAPPLPLPGQAPSQYTCLVKDDVELPGPVDADAAEFFWAAEEEEEEEAAGAALELVGEGLWLLPAVT